MLVYLSEIIVRQSRLEYLRVYSKNDFLCWRWWNFKFLNRRRFVTCCSK